MNLTLPHPHSLSPARPAAWLWAALFVAGNILLPHLCHLVPSGGKIFLPIMLFTVVATVRFGVWCGLITALASPLVSVALFGVPSGAILTAVLVKGMVIALVFGVWREKTGGYTLLSLAGLVVACQLICLPFEGAVLFGFSTSWHDLLISLPGMALQWIAAVLALKYWK